MKKTFYSFLILILIILISSINIVLKINSDLNHIIGTDIILGLFLLIVIACTITTNIIFKKSNLKDSKNFKKDIKIAFANSFVTSSIISIISACIIYGFLKNILELINLKEGLINYTMFAAKIWFITSPFIGLEIAVFKYFSSIDYLKRPIQLFIFKILLFSAISFLYFKNGNISGFIYSKPLCDIIFLAYYSRICFDITLNKAWLVKIYMIEF